MDSSSSSGFRLSKTVARISSAAQDHYGQVQGCINLLEVIEQQERGGVSIDESITSHLTESQMKVLQSLVKQLGEYMLKVSDGEAVEPFSMSAAGHDHEAFATFLELVASSSRKVLVPKGAHVLQRSVLITLVIGFETLLSSLATAIIRDNPAVVKLENASLSLAELESLGSVSEASDYLVSRHVEDLARGSIEDWVKWFEKIGVKLRDIPADWVQFREIFARRNLFVHTNGRVSAQYISTLAAAGAASKQIPERDSAIDVTNEYLAESCELIMSVGALLGISVWMKLDGNNLDRPVSWALQTAERALADRNYHACFRLTEKMAAVLGGRADLVTSCRLKTLNWTARAMLGDQESVGEEAKNWDVRGIDTIYSHVRSMLIGDDEQALREISALIESNRLPKVAVLTGVLYEKLRERLGSRVFEALGVDKPGLTLDAAGGEPSLEIAT